MTEYQIHDNGGRPFTVEVAGNQVDVYLNTHIKGVWEKGDHLHTFQAARVWVPKGESPRFSSPDGDKYPEDISLVPWKGAEGNTILLEDADGSYVHIGAEITRFQPQEAIADFRSPVGNSNVAYPYATSANYTYLVGSGKMSRRPAVRTPREDEAGVWSEVYEAGIAFDREVLTPRRW